MSGSSSKSKSKTQSHAFTNQFDFTDLELELADINFEIVGQQLDALMSQNDFQQAVFGAVGPALQQMLINQDIQASVMDPASQATRLQQQLASADTQAAATDDILQMQLQQLQGGPSGGIGDISMWGGHIPGASGGIPVWDGSLGLTQEQSDLINANTQSQLDLGASNIQKFGQDAIDMITQELAPSRGLRPTDTPIQDRAFGVGTEMTRQFGNLSNQLSAQAAQQMLQYPLQSAAMAQQGAQVNQSAIGLGQNAAQLGLGANQQWIQNLLSNAQLGQRGQQLWNQNAQFNQQLGQANANFGQNLQNQAFNNRLSLIGTAGNLGLGAVGAAQPASNFQMALKPQLGQDAKSTTKTSQKSGGGGISSKALKTEKATIDYNAVLAALEAVPVERWRYIDGAVPDDINESHIGPYAEDFLSAFSVGDGRTINFMDAIGVSLACIKALAARVEELEARNG